MYLKIFSDDERNKYFGKAPSTVYENLVQLDKYPKKLNVLKRNNVFNDVLINSFKLAVIQRWTTEISSRVISNYMHEIRTFKILHGPTALDLDVSTWMKINDLRHYIMKDTYATNSLFTRVRESLVKEDYSDASRLCLELDDKMSKLRRLYSDYKRNLIDIY